MIKCPNCGSTAQVYRNGYKVFQNKQQALRYVWDILQFYEWLAVGKGNHFDILYGKARIAPPIKLISVKRKTKKNGDIQVIFTLNRSNIHSKTVSYTITEVTK